MIRVDIERKSLLHSYIDRKYGPSLIGFVFCGVGDSFVGHCVDCLSLVDGLGVREGLVGVDVRVVNGRRDSSTEAFPSLETKSFGRTSSRGYLP